MKNILSLVISLPVLLTFTAANQKPGHSPLTDLANLTNMTYSLLSLGDSYTIGESVLLTGSFPYQAVQMLRKSGYNFIAPEIIAKTGWTTDELQAAINQHKFLPAYDFVTLLIGVNNQYRGRSVENYKPEFESLLKQAIQFAGNKAYHVIVLSIPDWSVTPFAEGRDRKKLAQEIDEYNSASKSIAEKYKVYYVDITTGTREAATDTSLVAPDGLHPSAKEYSRWAEKIAILIKAQL
jgi:lysophospholipase L1-like esterase